MPTLPSYLEAFNNGTLTAAAKKARAMLGSCAICPRRCQVNRLKGSLGFCKTAADPLVYSFMAHHGEEPPISGSLGSGTIFFSHCNMGCVYCQNYEFSQRGGGGGLVDPKGLAEIMLELQGGGVHNINLVTPTHVIPAILEALKIAIPAGLKIPLVYNSGGYELAEIILLLKGIVDIYLVDMRYGDEASGAKYSFAPDYPRFNQEAVIEMHRQVGIAQLDDKGIMCRGLVIRHLVLPQGLSGTEIVMRFIKEKISPETYISLMSQYMPYYKAREFPEISRRLNQEEYAQTQEIMLKYGLHNGWIQDSYGLERFAGVNIKPFSKHG